MVAADGICLEFRPHVELHYRILSQIDLGDNAANLFRGETQPPRWAEELQRLYRRAPGRLMLQVVALIAEDLDVLLQLLEPGQFDAFDDADSRRLARRFSEILQREEERWLPEAVSSPLPGWLDVLAQCRRHLWSQLDADCPPLRIIDVPSLADGEWTHGRATTVGGERVVAVSLDVGEAAFVQLLHEEIHPVTDPVVRQQFGDRVRGTAPGDEGYEIHREIEGVAVEVGRALVEERAPQFRELYRRWERRYGP